MTIFAPEISQNITLVSANIDQEHSVFQWHRMAKQSLNRVCVETHRSALATASHVGVEERLLLLVTPQPFKLTLANRPFHG
jgi:hypothetical protein